MMKGPNSGHPRPSYIKPNDFFRGETVGIRVEVVLYKVHKPSAFSVLA